MRTNDDLVDEVEARAVRYLGGRPRSGRVLQALRRVDRALFLPGRSNPVTLPHGSPVLFLLERLRDEAHRFAVTYHRQLRGRSQLATALTAIPGVGP